MNNILRFTADIPNLTAPYKIVNIDNIIYDLGLIEIDFPTKTINFTIVIDNLVCLHQMSVNRTNNRINIFIGTNNNRFAFIHISNINEPYVGFIMDKPATNDFENSLLNDNFIKRLNKYNHLNYFICNSNNALNSDHLRALNNFYIRQCINLSNRVLCAWGNNGTKPIILNNMNVNNMDDTKLYQYTENLTKNHKPINIARKSKKIMNSIIKEMTDNNNNNNEHIYNIHNINIVR